MAATSFPDIPSVGLSYLEELTDDFGIWQHALPDSPDRKEGYALDDAARAFLAALAYGRTDLADIYAAFMLRACSGYETPVNFMSAERKPVFSRGHSDDALGQVWWCLGQAEAVGYVIEGAELIRERVLPVLQDTLHLRSHAYALLGGGPLPAVPKLAPRLIALCREHEGDGWYWPERSLTYANAILPYALLKVGQRTHDEEALSCALRMLDFLNEACTHDGKPIAIGNKGWYRKGGQKALFDQQPIDPAYQVIANMGAYEITGKEAYRDQARRYLSWFWGNNLGSQVMVNRERESFYDGLWEDGRSSNQGAENVVCYLLAQAAYQQVGKD